MVVSVPPRIDHIDLDIPDLRGILFEMDHGVEEVGARAAIPKTWMKNADASSIVTAKVSSFDTLMGPDLLQQEFRRIGG